MLKKKIGQKKADDETKKAYQEGIESVENSGILANAKNIGDIAPDFSLTNAVKEQTSLYEYLEKGPVVLTWYRGGWCPYCNLTLQRLQQIMPDIQQLGGNLLALTPELPDQSLSTVEKHELNFEVLSDVGNKVARTYGLVFKLTNEVADIYQKSFDLHGYNGDESNELPLAATYVIDQNKVIQYAFLDAEYRHRAEPYEILEVLRTINDL